MFERARLVEDLNPLLGKAYEAVARGASRDDAVLSYKPSFDRSRRSSRERPEPLNRGGEVRSSASSRPCSPRSPVRRRDELERGVSLVGPHRDDLLCSLGEFPVKGYASHGESWSFALAMRLASYELLRSTGDDPVLILDDVFAELDTGRRAQLADLVSGAEQVLVTAAVPADIPEGLRGRRFDVADGEVTPVEQ